MTIRLNKASGHAIRADAVTVGKIATPTATQSCTLPGALRIAAYLVAQIIMQDEITEGSKLDREYNILRKGKKYKIFLFKTA